MAKTINLYNIKGVKKLVAVPEIFTKVNKEINLNLLALAMHVYRQRSHIGLSKAKTRSEVNRTKKKIYKQKGTGNARHGARSAPIFVGGGKAHGPRPIERSVFINKKMAKKALFNAFSLKLKNNEIVLADGIDKASKTKDMQFLISKIYSDLKIKKNKRATLVIKDQNKKSSQNIKNLITEKYNNLNAKKVLEGGLLIFDNNLFEVKKVSNIKTKKKVSKKWNLNQ